MTPSAEKHLQRFPSARPSKLKQLEKRDEVTATLQRELSERRIRQAAGILYPLRVVVRRFFGLDQ